MVKIHKSNHKTRFTNVINSISQVTTTSTVPVADQEDANQDETENTESTAKPNVITKKIKRKIASREYNKEEIAVINQRNMELIQTLRTLDSAFSMGESG